jgi:uncharacterized membrane protein
MSQKTTLVIVVTLVLASVLAGVILWNQLPDSMASHWGADDQVNGYTSKFWGIFLVPLITIGMLLMFQVIPLIDPLKANIAQFRSYFNSMIALLTAFMVYVHGLTLAWNLGYNGFRMSSAMLPAMGLLFIFIGLMISKSKRNYFIGIRTPWTLSSDRVWDETHRVGGKLFVASGLLALLGAFFPDQALWFILVPVLGASFGSVIYSFVIYQREIKA